MMHSAAYRRYLSAAVIASPMSSPPIGSAREFRPPSDTSIGCHLGTISPTSKFDLSGAFGARRMHRPAAYDKFADECRRLAETAPHEARRLLPGLALRDGFPDTPPG